MAAESIPRPEGSLLCDLGESCNETRLEFAESCDA